MTGERSDTVGWDRKSALNKAAMQRQGLAVAGMVVWMASALGATLVLRGEFVAPHTAMAYAIAAASSLLGVAAVFAFFLFLRSCDELQQRIQLNGLALGFGAGLVFMWGYRLLERAGAPSIDVNDPGAVMVLFYAIGVAASSWRYR